MKTKLLVSLALSAFTFLPLTAQQGTVPSTPDRQNPTQNSSDNNSAPDAQRPDNQPNPGDQPNGQVFSYRVTVVERTTEAVDYRDRGGTTQVDFKGTSLMPSVDGNAKVTGHTGRLAIDATLHHLAPPRPSDSLFLRERAGPLGRQAREDLVSECEHGGKVDRVQRRYVPSWAQDPRDSRGG